MHEYKKLNSELNKSTIRPYLTGFEGGDELSETLLDAHDWHGEIFGMVAKAQQIGLKLRGLAVKGVFDEYKAYQVEVFTWLEARRKEGK